MAGRVGRDNGDKHAHIKRVLVSFLGTPFVPALESDFALWPWLAYNILRFESPDTPLWDFGKCSFVTTMARMKLEDALPPFFFFHHRYRDTYKPFFKRKGVRGRFHSVLFYSNEKKEYLFASWILNVISILYQTSRDSTAPFASMRRGKALLCVLMYMMRRSSV